MSQVLIVDDEKLAIQGLQLRLEKYPDVEIIVNRSPKRFVIEGGRLTIATTFVAADTPGERTLAYFIAHELTHALQDLRVLTRDRSRAGVEAAGA